MQSAADNAPAKGNESSLRRRLIGFFMFPVALFPALALLSYDWRDIPELRIPPNATANFIGAAGNWFAYIGYQTIGLAIWSVPVICFFVGILPVILCQKFRTSGSMSSLRSRSGVSWTGNSEMRW